MCPWNLLSSSNNFTLYLSSYSVFLSSIAGVMICDYYWVRKGYLETKNLYSALKTGPYYYTIGIHFRAYVAYIAGILINVVGFVGAIGTKVPLGATYIYKYLHPNSPNLPSDNGLTGSQCKLFCRVHRVLGNLLCPLQGISNPRVCGHMDGGGRRVHGRSFGLL